MIKALEQAAQADEYPPMTKLHAAAAEELLHLQMLEGRIGTVMNNIRRLLEQVGRRSRCKTCNKEIWYVQLRSGMVGPYQADALNHGAGCEDDDLNKGGPPCGTSSDPTPGPGPSEG